MLPPPSRGFPGRPPNAVSLAAGGRSGPQPRFSPETPRTFSQTYQEGVIINMLEVFMYHDYAAEALGDGVVDLIDFCMRKVSHLIRM